MAQDFIVRPARIATVCGAAVAGLGLVILFAWAVGNEPIKTIQPGWPTMKANTALGLLACGSSLVLCARGFDRWARLPAALAVAIGALTLAQYLFAVDLGIDELLFPDHGSAAGTTAPGRLAVLTAADLILVALPLLAWRVPTRAGTLAVLIAGFIALFNLAFFFLGAIPPVQGTRMAVHTAASFLVLCIGGLVGREGELAKVILGRGETGATARLLLVPVVALPLVFGLLARGAVRDGLVTADQGRAFSVFANLSVLAVLVAFALVRLGRESERRTALEAERTNLQTAMKASEGRMRTIFANSPVGIILTRVDGVVVDLNPAAEVLWGRSRAEFLDPGFRMEQLYADPSERARVIQALREHGGSVELRMKRGDGQIRRMSFSVTVIELASQKVFLASGLDITDLRDSEERFRLLFESNPVAVAVASADGSRLLDVNPAFERLVGIPATELTHPAFDAATLAGADRAGHARLLQALGQGGSDAMDLTVRRRDGSERAVVASARPLEFAGGRALLLAMQDVTEEREGAERLRRAQERFARIFEASPVAIALTRNDGRVVDANPALQQLSGYTLEELTAPGFRAGQLYEEPAARERVVGMLHETGIVRELELGLRRKDGGLRTVLVSLEFVDLGGNTTILSMFLDVTERKRLESERQGRSATEAELERLRRTEQFRTEFINSTAHELRTPMTSLVVSLSALRIRLESDALAARSLATIQRAVDRLNRVVADMVAAADLQARALAIDPRPVDVTRQLRTAVAVHARSAQRAGVRLEEPPATGLPVLADEQRLHLALGHLLGNAIKFTPAGGRVTLASRRDGDRVRIEVTDTGMGLTQAQMDRLWRPFSQEHDKGQRTDSGSGLGLYVTAGIIALHGGEVGCSSPGPGKGSTFWFTLPVAPGS